MNQVLDEFFFCHEKMKSQNQSVLHVMAMFNNGDKVFVFSW